MKIIPLVVLLAFSSAAYAQEKMTGDAFDSYSIGTTLYFSQDGLHYGSEQFLPDRRTVWRDDQGNCVNGKWAEIQEGICFLYDGSSELHCWSLVTVDGVITITSQSPEEGESPTVLEVSGQDEVPIICTGPSVGV